MLVKELALEKDPLGALQTALVALPPKLPLRLTGVPGQVLTLVPALVVAAAFTVMTTVEMDTEQGPPAASGSALVRVRVTVPLLMLGV